MSERSEDFVDGIVRDGADTPRCWWPGVDPLYLDYHDREWGRPVADDRRLFEKICLEGFQSGLSWLTILRKRENFRAAFADFDAERIVRFDDTDRGLFAWAGFRWTTIPVTMEERHAGTSQWGFLKLLRLAAAAITSFGTLPLKIWAIIGSIVSASALLYGLYVVVKTLLFGADVPGFPSLMVAILFFAGVQLIGMGIIGEYLGHVFSEVKRRPLYFEREALGFDRPLRLPGSAPGFAPPEVRRHGRS